MKKLLLFGCGTLLAAVLTAPALAAQPAVPSGPLTMSLTKKPVIFDHAQHSKLPSSGRREGKLSEMFHCRLS